MEPMRPEMRPRPQPQPQPLRYRRLEPLRPSHENSVAAAKKSGAEATVKKEEEKEKEDDAEEEEPGLAEMEDVEYEDAYVSERPPMTFQLKEDSERDEFM